MQDKRKNAGRFNRRIELLKPASVTSEYNENQTAFVVAYSNFPASRTDSSSTNAENMDNHVIAGSILVEWELRFVPGLNIKTNWKLKDLHDGNIYEIISPSIEIGQRLGIRVVTKLIQ